MSKEIKIALLGIVSLALSIWGYQFLSGKNFLSGDQVYYGLYDNVQEVNTATKVQINGLVVGSVITIQPEPQNVRKIRLGFTVNKDIKLPDYTVAELRSAGALGGKVIELVFDKMCDGSNCAENKTLLASETVGLIGSLINPAELDPALSNVNSIIDSTLGRLGSEDSNTAIDVSIRKLSETMANFSSLTERMNGLMVRSSKNIELTMGNLAVLTESLVQSQDKLGRILENVSVATEDFKKIQLSNTVDKTNATIDQANTSLAGVETTMQEANATLKELTQIMAELKEGKGTMGKLLNDESLYNNLSETTREMDLLLQDIRLNPRRYFKVFGKKVPKYELPEDDPALNIKLKN